MELCRRWLINLQITDCRSEQSAVIFSESACEISIGEKEIQLGDTTGEGDLAMIVDIFLVNLKSIFKCTFVLFITL